MGGECCGLLIQFGSDHKIGISLYLSVEQGLNVKGMPDWLVDLDNPWLYQGYVQFDHLTDPNLQL
jgi:hypothetical protein